MKNVLDKLRVRVGDFWWYSIMIFLACRSGDVIQAFTGLWLVPKYVGPEELGAVLPLQQLCGLFAVPLTAFATVFTKYVNTYAARGEYGKVKSFIIDVLLASIAVFAVCIVAAYFLLPHFYLRLNVTAGMLTVLILASGFIGNISQLFTNALRGLKKFDTLAIISFIGSPIRLITLLVAMPFRALSGYIVGQTTPPATSALIAAFSLRKDLASTPTDTSWRKDLPIIFRYFLPILIYLAFNTLFNSISATIYRQRLPEIESAAYYILSRFAEISTYVGASMIVVLFPLAAEAHEKAQEDTTALRKTIGGIVISTSALAIVFASTARWAFSLIDTWSTYQSFTHLLPIMTISVGASTILSAIYSYETACRRFGFSGFLLAVNALWIAFLFLFTGYGFFRGFLPDGFIDWIASTKMASLKNLTWAQLITTLLQVSALPFVFKPKKRPTCHA